MRNAHYITTESFEKLKRDANKLKKAEGIPLHKALDQVAYEYGNVGKGVTPLSLWKHVVEDHKETLEAEAAIKHGTIVIVDRKDAFERNTSPSDMFVDNRFIHNNVMELMEKVIGDSDELPLT